MAGFERPWGSTGLSWLLCVLVLVVSILALFVPILVGHLDLILIAALAAAMLL